MADEWDEVQNEPVIDIIDTDTTEPGELPYSMVVAVGDRRGRYVLVGEEE